MLYVKRNFIFQKTHPSAIAVLEKEIKNAIWNPCTKCMLQIHFVSFDYIFWGFCFPPRNHPKKKKN